MPDTALKVQPRWLPSRPFQAVVGMGCLILILALAGCGYVRNVNLLRGGHLERTAFVDSVAFDIRLGLVIVEGRLSSSDSVYQFIFDTAAFDNKVEYDLATRLGLEVVSSKTSGSAQGISRRIETIRIDSFRIGDTVFAETGGGKLHYASTSASVCLAPHGIIGGNLIRLANWQIDFTTRTLRFSDLPFSEPDDGVWIPFDTPRLSGVPSIALQVEGQRVKDVLFDIGYNGGLVLPMEWAERFDEPVAAVIKDRSTSGIHGANEDSLIVKHLRVRVGDAEARIPVEFSALDKALLGTEVLEHFRITLDYEEDRIHLSPVSPLHVPAPRSFLPGILNDSTWVVNRVAEGLPLQLGQELALIDGQRPTDLFATWCDYVRGYGNLFSSGSLRVQTPGGQELVVPSRVDLE